MGQGYGWVRVGVRVRVRISRLSARAAARRGVKARRAVRARAAACSSTVAEWIRPHTLPAPPVPAASLPG